MLTTFLKDPTAILDYTIDWSAWLEDETIITSTWAVIGDVELSDDENFTSLTLVWASGGTEGTLADLTNQIVTTGGRTNEVTIRLILRQE